MQTVNFKYLDLQVNDTVLDLGCGEGRHIISIYLEQNIQAVGVDLSIDNLFKTQEKFWPFYEKNNSKKNFGLSAATALQLPFPDSSFDKIICSEVLEHIEDFESVLQEIERVLKPGGLFCASVPRTWPERVCWSFSDDYHNVEGGHLRIFDASKLKKQIEALGFKHYHKHWAHALHSPFWWLKCLFWQTQNENWLIKQYHRFLVWDLMDRPLLTHLLEKILNPIMGKSVVMYFKKEAML